MKPTALAAVVAAFQAGVMTFAVGRPLAGALRDEPAASPARVAPAPARPAFVESIEVTARPARRT